MTQTMHSDRIERNDNPDLMINTPEFFERYGFPTDGMEEMGIADRLKERLAETLLGKLARDAVDFLDKKTSPENLFENANVETNYIEVDGIWTDVITVSPDAEDSDHENKPVIFLATGIFSDFEMYSEYIQEMVNRGYKVIGANFKHNIPWKMGSKGVIEYQEKVTAEVIREAQRNTESNKKTKMRFAKVDDEFIPVGHSRGTGNSEIAADLISKEPKFKNRMSVLLLNPTVVDLKKNATVFLSKFYEIIKHAGHDIAQPFTLSTIGDIAALVNIAIIHGNPDAALSEELRLARTTSTVRHLLANITDPYTVVRTGLGILEKMDQDNEGSYKNIAIQIAKNGVPVDIYAPNGDTVLIMDDALAKELETSPVKKALLTEDEQKKRLELLNEFDRYQVLIEEDGFELNQVLPMSDDYIEELDSRSENIMSDELRTAMTTVENIIVHSSEGGHHSEVLTDASDMANLTELIVLRNHGIYTDEQLDEVMTEINARKNHAQLSLAA